MKGGLPVIWWPFDYAKRKLPPRLTTVLIQTRIWRVLRSVLTRIAAAHGLQLFLRHTGLGRLDIKPLRADSWFIDVGGYKGACTHGIFEEFRCNVVVFEPASDAIEHLKSKFAGIDAIRLEHCAVSDRDGVARLYLAPTRDGNSLFQRCSDPGEAYEDVRTVDIVHYLDGHDIRKIDLLKLNCEGSEWEILRSLIRADRIADIDQIVVQWHSAGPDETGAEREELRKTHDVVTDNRYWEVWRLRS